MITKNVWRIRKDNFHNAMFGAVVKYKEYNWFIELDTDDEVEKFEKFISENDVESERVMETKLQQQFCVTDCDNEEYYYNIKN